jgi:hypothetical protein
MTAAAATRLVCGPRCRAEPPRSVRSRDDVPVMPRIERAGRAAGDEGQAVHQLENAPMGRSATKCRSCCSITMAQPARRRDQAGKLYPPAIQRWVSLQNWNRLSL